MPKKDLKMSRDEAYNLGRLFDQLAVMVNLPIKVQIAKNSNMLREFRNDYDETKLEKFNDAVKCDEAGLPVLLKEKQKEVDEKMGTAEEIKSIPFEWYDYQNKTKKEKFLKWFDEYRKEEVDITFLQVLDDKVIVVNRTVLVKEEPVKVSKEVTLSDYLEEVDNQLNPGTIQVLLRYCIKESA